MPKKRPAATTPDNGSVSLWWFVLLLVAVAAAYRPAWHGALLWDDDAHLTPEDLRSWSGLARIWMGPGATQQYYPITNTAFWLMARLWGSATLGYHLVNILLHASSAFLVLVILRRLGIAGAVVAAAVFALHPVHVESVAWMSELKNVLSGVFYLSAFLAYLRFDDTRDRRAYAVALVLFVLALGCKTVTATLPAGLLVVLWWRRGRGPLHPGLVDRRGPLHPGLIDRRGPLHPGLVDRRGPLHPASWVRDVRPLVPFFALGLAAGLFTSWFEYQFVGAKGAEFALGPMARVLVAGRAIWFYVWKLVWPANLSFNYAHWAVDPRVWWQYLFPLGVAVALAGLAIVARKTRAPLAAALYFIVTLSPALGFVNVYPFRYSFVADHFQYLASIGLVAAICAGLAGLLRRYKPAAPEAILAIALALPLATLTYLQSREYVSADIQNRATIRRNPWTSLARNNLGEILLNGPSTGWPEAISLFQAVLSFKPDDPTAHNMLGLAWQKLGRHDDAIQEFRMAIRAQPRLAQAHYNLGLSLFETGRLEESVAEYETALRIQPAAAVHHNLALALRRQRRSIEALPRLRAAVATYPDSRELHFNLAETLVETGAPDDAIREYRESLRRWPDEGQSWNNLGEILRRTGTMTEALEALRTAERLLPDSPLVQANLATLLLSMNRLEEAIAPLERAIQLSDPSRQVVLHNAAGVLLMRLNRSAEAVPHFEAALRLRSDYTEASENLAKARKAVK